MGSDFVLGGMASAFKDVSKKHRRSSHAKPRVYRRDFWVRKEDLYYSDDSDRFIRLFATSAMCYGCAVARSTAWSPRLGSPSRSQPTSTPFLALAKPDLLILLRRSDSALITGGQRES